MKRVYFVTEGLTDQLVLEALIAEWLGDEDFESNFVQPPTSAYAEFMNCSLSQGWKGVLAWCSSESSALSFSRQRVVEDADLLVVHMDGDVAFENDFPPGAFGGGIPPAQAACDHIRAHLCKVLDDQLIRRDKVVFCIPSQSIEAWILCCLFPEVADANIPIECHLNPEILLIERTYRLTRRKDGRVRKNTDAYRAASSRIVANWANCAGGASPRCVQAARFEIETRAIV